MKGSSSIGLAIFSILGFVRSEKESRQIGCQQRSTSGRDYMGEANTTIDGIPCQRWSETHPHDHDFTYVGDHNFCRNPNGASQSQVWCFTTDPKIQSQYCTVPFCPISRAIDFSLDSDNKPDENASYTHASLQNENQPPSFTICTAFMVEVWNLYREAPILILLDNMGDVWHYLWIFVTETYTEFDLSFEQYPGFSKQREALFYPLQWTRVCLSKDSETSLVRLVWTVSC